MHNLEKKLHFAVEFPVGHMTFPNVFAVLSQIYWSNYTYVFFLLRIFTWISIRLCKQHYLQKLIWAKVKWSQSYWITSHKIPSDKLNLIMYQFDRITKWFYCKLLYDYNIAINQLENQIAERNYFIQWI